MCIALSGCGGGSSHKSSQGSGGTTRTLASITVYGANAARSLAAGSTLQLTAQGNYSDGTIADLTSQVTWSSSDTTVAALSASGLITSYKSGSLIATAAKGSVSGTLGVTVAGLKSITVTAPVPSLVSGATEQLTASAVYSESSTQSITSQAAWQSSDPTVAVVDAGGKLTAQKTGSVSVTATWNSISGTAGVSVPAAALSSITVTPLVFSIASGQSKQLSALVVYADGTSQDVSSQATWSSSTSATTVDASGLVTGSSAGTSTITATIGSKSGSAAATVSAS